VQRIRSTSSTTPPTQTRNRLPGACPLGKHVVIEQQFDCPADWREVAGDVRGHALDCGHFLPEERLEEVARELENFLG